MAQDALKQRIYNRILPEGLIEKKSIEVRKILSEDILSICGLFEGRPSFFPGNTTR
jgi:hypothetical protein